VLLNTRSSSDGPFRSSLPKSPFDSLGRGHGGGPPGGPPGGGGGGSGGGGGGGRGRGGFGGGPPGGGPPGFPSVIMCVNTVSFVSVLIEGKTLVTSTLYGSGTS